MLSITSKILFIFFIFTSSFLYSLNTIEIEEDYKICTLEYSPVCGVDKEETYVTFGNKCLLENSEVFSFSYTGECRDLDFKDFRF